MDEFLIVFGVSCVAALLTYLGAPIAERFEVPHRVISAALQFAAGIITALVAVTLMPPAVRHGPAVSILGGFFIGGALYVTLEYYSARRAASKPAGEGGPISLGLYAGILADLVIDGVLIGIGSSLTLSTGLLVAVALAVSTVPLAFVTTATAKRQGVPKEKRRLLSYLFAICIIGGALLGYGVLRNIALGVKMTLIALGSGFLVTTVTQSMIPEANREGEPSFAGILFIGGLSLYAMATLWSL
jgi:ZIP family zinc transporter